MIFRLTTFLNIKWRQEYLLISAYIFFFCFSWIGEMSQRCEKYWIFRIFGSNDSKVFIAMSVCKYICGRGYSFSLRRIWSFTQRFPDTKTWRIRIKVRYIWFRVGWGVYFVWGCPKNVLFFYYISGSIYRYFCLFISHPAYH